MFAAAVKPTVPEPLRPVPLEMVTHDAPLVAVQLHPSPVVTLTLLVPPMADITRVGGQIVKLQGTPACVIENELVPTLMLPVRASVPVFAASE